jgi:hypothetical protein
MCGEAFLLRSTFERHRAREFPSFVARAVELNEAYSAKRKAYAQELGLEAMAGRSIGTRK